MIHGHRLYQRKANVLSLLGLTLLVVVVLSPVLAAADEEAAPSRPELTPPQGLEVSAFGDTCSSSIACPDCLVKVIGSNVIEFCGLSHSNGFCTCQTVGSSCSVTGACTYSGWGGGGPPNT